MNTVRYVQSMPIRKAIRIALQKASFAKDTGNRELYQHLRYWLQCNIKLRNTGQYIYN